ncbi:MAG: Npt1/Npt2 family nucleotide transporter [Vicinamibacterales bacterium]
MLRALGRILDLSDDELRRSWPVFAYLFLTMSGTVASKATRDALFLDRYRAIDLPYVDIAIAVLVGLVVSLYIRASRWLPLRTLQIGSLLFFAANCLAFWGLSRLSDGSGGLFVAIYLWVGLFSVLAPAQVWTLANFVLTTREAKRAFGFIGSGAILGWIVGGFATRITAAWLGTETLLLWVALSLVLSAGLVHLAWQRAAPPAVDTRMQALGLRASLQQISQSPYLRSIAWVVGLSAFATTIGGWQFKALAKAHVPDTDQLAAFFGTFNMVAGAASLVLQVVLTGRVLRAFGVGVALFIVPVAMASASLGVIVLGTLAAASALKASDQVLRYSIDKATVELLYLPLSAADTFRVKSFIDTVVYRLGDGMGGLAVLAAAAWFGWNPMQVGWVTLAAVLAWMAAAAAARTRYVSNLQDSIHQHRVDAERAHAPMLDRDATEALVRKLRGEPADILYALSLFEASNLRTVHPVVPSLLAHESPDVRVRAVALLSRTSVLSVRREIETLLRDPHLEVRTEALLYMTRHTNTDPLTVIEEVGDFPDFSIRASMIAFLARPGPAQNLEAAQLMLQRMVAEGGDEGIRSRAEAARVIGLVPDVFDRELRKLLEDEAPEVAREAVRSAGLLGKRQLAHRLIDRIAEPWLTDAVVEALARMGDRVVGTVRDHLVDRETPAAVRRELPAALQAIGTPAAQHVLVESMLDSDTVVRTRVLTALNKLVQLHPGRRLDRQIVETALAAEITGHYRSYQMLATIGGSLASAEPVVLALHESLDGESERIFRLLKILYPEHDLHSAFVGIQSDDPSVHDNALEFLDNILAPHVRALVVPLFDRAITPETRARAADRLVGVAVGTRDEAIAVMTQSRDPWLQSCAAYAIGELRLAAFAETIDRWTSDPDPLLRATAVAARAKLKDRAAVPAVDVG